MLRKYNRNESFSDIGHPKHTHKFSKKLSKVEKVPWKVLFEQSSIEEKTSKFLLSRLTFSDFIFLFKCKKIKPYSLLHNKEVKNESETTYY